MFRISDKLQVVASTFMAQGLRIVTTLFMARWVPPKERGLFIAVLSISGLIGAIGDFNIPAVLVQMRDFAEEAVVDTGMAVGVVLYCAYALLNIGGGFYISYKYHDARAVWIGVLIGITNILNFIYSVQLASLNRKLQFRAESKQNIIFSVSQALTGITCAVAGMGVFALALQALIGQIIASVMMCRRIALRWPRHFSWDAAKRYIGLGGKVTIANYCSNVQTNILNMFILSSGGTPALGEWDQAVRVQQMFGQNLLVSFERVTYPMLCDARGNDDRMRSIFSRALITLMLFSMFAAAWLIVGGPDLVHVVLGPEWANVPRILAVIALAVPAGAMFSVGCNTAFALGKTGWLLRASMFDLVVFFPLVLVTRRFGVTGLACSWALSKCLIGTLVIVWGAREIRPQAWAMVLRIAGLALAAAIAGAVMYFAARWMGDLPLKSMMLSRIIRLGWASTAAAVVYFGIVFITQRDTIVGALRIARGSARGSPAARDQGTEPPDGTTPPDSAVAAGAEGNIENTGPT